MLMDVVIIRKDLIRVMIRFVWMLLVRVRFVVDRLVLLRVFSRVMLVLVKMVMKFVIVMLFI